MKYWIAVASREHVLNGTKWGIMQVCHGKIAPLKSMRAGDWLIYYSSKETFEGNIPCRRFTAIGRVTEREPYQFQMSEDFIPWRRDVIYRKCNETDIEPLIDDLSFIKDKKRWGFPFRRGCFSIPENDFHLIAESMGVSA